MYNYELHAHTSECDRDAMLSARELVHLYKNAGYDGMVITDHYIERFYTLWCPEDVKGLTHEQQGKALAERVSHGSGGRRKNRIHSVAGCRGSF